MDEFDWLTSFKRKEISLAEAVSIYLTKSGAPELLVQLYDDAVDRYQSGEISDLAVALGIAMSKREKNKMEQATWISHVKFMVDGFAEKGLPRNNPDTYPTGTAFHAAAEYLKISPSRVFDIYYKN